MEGMVFVTLDASSMAEVMYEPVSFPADSSRLLYIMTAHTRVYVNCEFMWVHMRVIGLHTYNAYVGTL